MAFEGVDASIPLQAGRNLPQYGPNWTTIQNSQRNMLAMQQAAQVQQAQNALKQVYSDAANFDPKTLQPTPEAFAALMRTSPAAGMDLQNNLVALQQKRALATNAQSTAMQSWRNRALDIAKTALDEYDAKLTEGAAPNAALAAAQEVYNKEGQVLKSSGMPQELQQLWQPFDPNRVRKNLMTVAQQQASEDLKKQGYQLIPQKTADGRVQQVWAAPGKPTLDMGGNPITATGIPADSKGTAPEFEAPVKGGDGSTKYVPVERGQDGGWYTADKNRTPVADASGLRKIGTKGESDAETAGTPTGPPDLHGTDYLKALPASRAAMIQGYAEGREPFPGSFSLRSPYWQKMLADITQYDPSFDAVNYNARARTRQDFVAGQSAKNITSFNTAIGHLGSLEKAGEALDNTRFPWVNTVANAVISQGGDPRVKQFDLARQAVSSELERAFRGTGGNVTEIEEWKRTLDAANSPAQLRGAVKQAVSLLASRIEAVGEQYRRGMGTTADVTELLTPTARKTLASLPGGTEILDDLSLTRQGTKGEPVPPAQGGISPPQGGAPPTQGAAAPAPPGGAPEVTREQYDKLPSGSPYRVPGNPAVMYKP